MKAWEKQRNQVSFRMISHERLEKVVSESDSNGGCQERSTEKEELSCAFKSGFVSTEEI